VRVFVAVDVFISVLVRVPNTAPNMTAATIATSTAAIPKRNLFFIYQRLYRKKDDYLLYEIKYLPRINIPEDICLYASVL
jgi:hypothetical protein